MKLKHKKMIIAASQCPKRIAKTHESMRMQSQVNADDFPCPSKSLPAF